MTDAAVKASWNEQIRREPAAAAALAIFVGSAATILGAWYLQYVLKYPPCELCLQERLPYHIVIPLSLLLAIAAIVRAPRVGLIGGGEWGGNPRQRERRVIGRPCIRQQDRHIGASAAFERDGFG